MFINSYAMALRNAESRRSLAKPVGKESIVNFEKRGQASGEERRRTTAVSRAPQAAVSQLIQAPITRIPVTRIKQALTSYKPEEKKSAIINTVRNPQIFTPTWRIIPRIENVKREASIKRSTAAPASSNSLERIRSLEANAQNGNKALIARTIRKNN